MHRDAISRNQCASLTDLFGVEFVAILCRGERSRYARTARIARKIVSIPPTLTNAYAPSILQNKNIFFPSSERLTQIRRQPFLFFFFFFLNNSTLPLCLFSFQPSRASKQRAKVKYEQWTGRNRETKLHRQRFFREEGLPIIGSLTLSLARYLAYTFISSARSILIRKFEVNNFLSRRNLYCCKLSFFISFIPSMV